MKETMLVGRAKGVRKVVMQDLFSKLKGRMNAKPVLVNKMLVEAYETRVNVELFARQNKFIDGWIAIGNEL